MVARCRRHRTNAEQRQAFRAYRTLKGPSALLRPLGNSSPCLIRQRLWSRIIAGGRRSQLGRRAIARPELCPFDRPNKLAASRRAWLHLNERFSANVRSFRGCQSAFKFGSDSLLMKFKRRLALVSQRNQHDAAGPTSVGSGPSRV